MRRDHDEYAGAALQISDLNRQRSAKQTNLPQREDYLEIYRLDMKREWAESAYDETGGSVFCDICGGEMKWQPNENLWRCADCGQEMRRAVYFDYIGAEPPGSECLTHCRENYPFCKKYCDRYLIDPRDPMLT